ncbi:MAG: DJ-1/PfpI family protein [Caulobacter sp.]|nr:DJ-1/PfpI family protein [Caulobacter sp.]
MKRCIALFHHGWADWEAGFVLAALREYFDFTIQIATPDGVEATSIGGVRAAADMAFADVSPDALDLLLVIGSERWSREANPEVVGLLRRVSAADKPLGAICAGTLAAARAGLLDSRAHTSNSLDFVKANAEGYSGASRYVDSPRAVSDGGVVTAAGSAPGSFSVAVLRLVVPDQAEMINGYEKMLAGEHRPDG